MALERFTILDRGPVHYCRECAETQPVIIKEIEEAYQREQLDIMHDEAVSSEICASCHRPITAVAAPQEVYEVVRQALLRLSALRRRVHRENDVLGRLFAGLDGADTPPSQSELEQAEKDLQQRVPGYCVWFEPRHARYCLVPKTDQENRSKA